MKQIFTIFILFIFYIFWTPIAFVKDLIQCIYVPFDIKRFLETYQSFCNNLFSMTKVHNKLIEIKDDPLDSGKDKPYTKQTLGFQVIEDDEEENIEEEYIDEEEV